MRNTTLKLILIVFFGYGLNSYGQLSITSGSTDFTIDFDNTVSGVNNGIFDASGFAPSPASGQIDSDGLIVTGASDGTMAFGGTYNTGDFARGTDGDGVTTGGIYAFLVGASNYAIGVQPTGTDFTSGDIILKITNNSGNKISAINLDYKIWILNDQDKSVTFNFSYSSDNSIYTSIGALDFTSTEVADGLPSWTSNDRNTEISSISLASGSDFYLKWTIDEGTGSGSIDEIALDDIIVNATLATAEPANHPTLFSASKIGTSQIDLSWTDAIGSPSPVGYLIKVSTTSLVAISDPSDGTVESDDTDLSDGSGAINISHGIGSYSWTGLSQLTEYFFKIYSYTNSDVNIDYKTDGTIQTASETTDHPRLFINEVRADDEGTDDAQFIELVGPAGLDITGYKIIHYNGAETTDTDIFSHTIGSFSIPDDGITDNGGTSLGYYVLSDVGVTNSDETIPASLQNGPDGIVLYDSDDNILDAVAWGGAGDLADDDPGTVSIAVAAISRFYLTVLPSDEANDNSLQAPNNVVGDDGSGWTSSAATPGALNSGQTSGSLEVPVELISFSASVSENAVLLSWNTATEIDNYGFQVERASTGSAADKSEFDWEMIGFVEGHGTTNSPQSYSFIDTKTSEGFENFEGVNRTFQYRLKQIDFDGKFEYSNVVEIQLDTELKYELFDNYPNPFNPVTTIRFSLPAFDNLHTTSLRIFNILGEQVAELVNSELSPGVHTVTFDANNLSSGIYFYRLETTSFSELKKMILIK
ncbi:MAG: T9SS type A sorting domain-containing protein [Melioribacteraceae bacterium]|nr:T9SS type A sorting domain-containing protein [Melioribacteraceae bacterium]